MRAAMFEPMAFAASRLIGDPASLDFDEFGPLVSPSW